MDSLKYTHHRILLKGTTKLTASIAVCLLRAKQQVTVFDDSPSPVMERIGQHVRDVAERLGEQIDTQNLSYIKSFDDAKIYTIAIVISNENADEKLAAIKELEEHLPPDALIAITSESIALSCLQKFAKCPARIIGVNWAEPAHTTYFMEIITNQNTDPQLAEDFCYLAKHQWQKDPYVLKSDFGIRSKMMSALVREASYLVENNYVTVEDIDRACRNDAGYYLPFAGNLRYMDLMGTYMYGIVMQDLNPELSKNTQIPLFCQQLIDGGGKGMSNRKGFYDYEEGEVEQWEQTFRTFSYQIQQIIYKYPFKYMEQESAVAVNATI